MPGSSYAGGVIGVIGPTQPHISYVEQIQGRTTPHKAAHQRATKILVSQELLDHTL